MWTVDALIADRAHRPQTAKSASRCPKEMRTAHDLPGRWSPRANPLLSLDPPSPALVGLGTDVDAARRWLQEGCVVSGGLSKGAGPGPNSHTHTHHARNFQGRGGEGGRRQGSSGPRRRPGRAGASRTPQVWGFSLTAKSFGGRDDGGDANQLGFVIFPSVQCGHSHRATALPPQSWPSNP